MDLAGSLADHAKELPRTLDDLLFGGGFEQRVAADDLFGLGERAVSDRDLAAGTLVHAHAGPTEMHALGRDEPSGLHGVFDELPHRGHLGLRRQAVRGFVRKDTDEAHIDSQSWCWQPYDDRRGAESTGAEPLAARTVDITNDARNVCCCAVGRNETAPAVRADAFVQRGLAALAQLKPEGKRRSISATNSGEYISSESHQVAAT